MMQHEISSQYRYVALVRCHICPRRNTYSYLCSIFSLSNSTPPPSFFLESYHDFIGGSLITCIPYTLCSTVPASAMLLPLDCDMHRRRMVIFISQSMGHRVHVPALSYGYRMYIDCFACAFALPLFLVHCAGSI